MFSSLFKKKQISEIIPFDSETKKLFEEGNLHYREGNLDKALEIYETCLKHNTFIPDIHNNKGEIFLLKNGIDSACEIFKEITEKFPDYPCGHYNMGIIYQKKGERKKALKEFNKAIKLEPSARFYNGLSSVYCDEGNFDRAIICLEKALKIDRLYRMSYINLSKVYLIQKKFNGAIKACEKALEISPGDSAVYNQLGRIYQSAGDFDRAIEFYLKVLEISPEMVQSHYSLSALYEQKKLYSKAIYHGRLYLTATEQDLKDTAVYRELKEKLGKLEKSPEFYVEQGAAYMTQERDEDAEELWKKALETDPSFVSANILLGGLYEKKGNFIKASAEYKRVLELRPDMEGIKKSLEEIFKRVKSEG